MLATLVDLHGFDTLIDVRTPLEFAEDHLPGAINAPVLSNEERVTIGTLYKQVSPFEATKLGAAMVAKNIAHHLERQFADRPINWKPLIYCWRGGKRSGSMTAWFRLIGWKACQLEGGYKSWRHHVLAELLRLPALFRFVVLGGLTGSGKTRLLHALAASGAQVLDLEQLAVHRGSVLGQWPGRAQPSQKWFDTQLVQTLSRFDPAKPVFVEAENKRIGLVQLPDSLMLALQQADCVQVETALTDRVALLCEDYASLFDQPDAFKRQLTRLTELVGHKQVAAWQGMVDHREMTVLFQALIEQHYDPGYRRSIGRLYPRMAQAPVFHFSPQASSLPDSAQRFLYELAAPAASVR
ncbi:tRNA 2-selenouridine(34) synthase MnmH [Chitinivorax sp. B]|uniref:tRNA 2-selenouridine(34) synthase MnmH n=1 Tax=Chitinivorax sp. B TaxID=2502235 RepID=UPI0010F5AFD0|nr:tRNA 2-selenouridine(34) synthase MnmH [Chitinivorax sp. B]